MMGLIPETLARVSLTTQYPKLGGITMKQTINLNDFRNAFQSIRPNNFSYEGLEVLFDYCEDLEVSCNKEMELDVIWLCCDYAESSFEESEEEIQKITTDLNKVKGLLFEQELRESGIFKKVIKLFKSLF